MLQFLSYKNVKLFFFYFFLNFCMLGKYNFLASESQEIIFSAEALAWLQFGSHYLFSMLCRSS